MTLLEDVQNSAVDGATDLATLLRKCKLLAAHLDSQPLADWLVWESNGYPDDVPVPEYRIWPLRVTGHFFGPFGSGIQNAPIPTICLPENVRKHYERYESRLSIASIETALKESSGTILVPTGDLALVLGAKVYRGQNCVQAWAEFGAGQLVELLNSVRNRILDFALAIGKETRDAKGAGAGAPTPLEAKRVTQIFNTTVYGGSANLIGAAHSSAIEFNIGPKNFAALERVLTENGIPPEDISELRTALESEPAPLEKEKYGPRVAGWVTRMMGKAAGGGWNIGLGAAGNLLAQAIAKYYGM